MLIALAAPWILIIVLAWLYRRKRSATLRAMRYRLDKHEQRRAYERKRKRKHP